MSSSEKEPAQDVADDALIDDEVLQIAEFQLRLGAFHHAFTALEHELNLLIIAAITGLSRHRRSAPYLAVLGGQRIKPAQDTIMRLLRATNASKRRISFTSFLFQQIGELAFFRDRLAHHLTTVSTNKELPYCNMNFAAIRELDKFEDIYFDNSALEAATDDAIVIRRIIDNTFAHYRPRGQSASTPERPSWRYKPTMLKRDRPNAQKPSRRSQVTRK